MALAALHRDDAQRAIEGIYLRCCVMLTERPKEFAPPGSSQHHESHAWKSYCEHVSIIKYVYQTRFKTDSAWHTVSNELCHAPSQTITSHDICLVATVYATSDYS